VAAGQGRVARLNPTWPQRYTVAERLTLHAQREDWSRQHRVLFGPPIRHLQGMYFHMMTRRISSGLAIAGLVIASPAIVDITSHFINKPLFLLKDLPETYAVVVMLCGICVIQYSYGFMMHII
jgi:hypothetical protein